MGLAMNMNAYPFSDLVIHRVMNKMQISVLNQLLDHGWVVVSSWIEDDPGSSPEILTNMRQSVQKLRAVSISGYRLLAYKGLGLGKICTLGVCNNIDWLTERNTHIRKVSRNEEVARETYKIVNMLRPDFVNSHNGFNFDLRCLAASSALDDMVGPTFSEKRLGNVGVCIFWEWDNGSMIVDSMYTASSELTDNWLSLALTKMADKFDLPLKMESGTMAITPSDRVDITNIIEYNARDSDLHV